MAESHQSDDLPPGPTNPAWHLVDASVQGDRPRRGRMER